MKGRIMWLKCPRCTKVKKYSIEQIMGKWVKCEHCHLIFSWKKSEYLPKQSKEGKA
jgi:uncharacterized C2H2 Zn-finger protein